MTRNWTPKKSDAARVTRARKAKALRAVRRGKTALDLEASRRADEGLDAIKRDLDQKVRKEPTLKVTNRSDG
jgi:hypothetical protein